MDDELNYTIVLNCPVSVLNKRIEEYRLDNNLAIGLWQYSNGTMHINQEWAGNVQGAIIGFDAPKPQNGQIHLTPYLNDVARGLPAAVEDLRRLREAIETLGGMMPRKSKRGPRPRTIKEKTDAVKAWDNLDRDIYAITLDDWLDERFGNTGGKLNVPASTFHGWRRYLENS